MLYRFIHVLNVKNTYFINMISNLAKNFQAGKSNVLICTCVGEEGLDIGEVNLIVCMDITTKNPTRFIQVCFTIIQQF